MSVNRIRKELNRMLLIYWIIRDCLDGEPAIKGWIHSMGSNISINPAAFNGGGDSLMFNNVMLTKAKFYLPMPNESDTSKENIDRYKQYLKRAVWYNVTARTLEGMVGQIFLIDPVIKLPSELEGMLKDVDDNGLSFDQNAKRAVRYTMAYGRAGLFIDYPATDSPVTQEQISSGQIKPIIQLVEPWNITNWRIEKRSGKNVLTQVIIREEVDSYDENDFGVNQSEQYRVLSLNDQQQYTVQIYEGDSLANGSKSKVNFTSGDIIVPTDSSGKPFNYIPFTFIGAENNDHAVDKPPMYDMAALNIAHYRNSADYEESSHLVGQPTPWASGLDKQWVDEILKGTIPLGSRAGIPLPSGATIGLLQANPNQMPLEAMKLKEDQMFALGAKLVTQKRTQRTATETKVDASSETSVLTNVANNVSAAYEFAFKVAAAFMGADSTDISVKLNTQFELNNLTPDDISKVIASWMDGAIAFSEMRDTVRKAGIANLTDDKAKAAINADRKEGLIPPAGMAAKSSVGMPNPNTDPAGHASTAAAAGQP